MVGVVQVSVRAWYKQQILLDRWHARRQYHFWQAARHETCLARTGGGAPARSFAVLRSVRSSRQANAIAHSRYNPLRYSTHFDFTEGPPFFA